MPEPTRTPAEVIAFVSEWGSPTTGSVRAKAWSEAIRRGDFGLALAVSELTTEGDADERTR